MGDVTWGSLPLMPPADLSISTSRCGTLRLHQRERTNEKYEKWPRWFQLHVAWSQGRDRYAALFYKMKEWVNGVRERANERRRKESSRRGFSERTRTNRRWVPFFNSSVKRKGVRKHQQDIAAGKRTNSFLRKQTEGDKNYIHIYQNY